MPRRKLSSLFVTISLSLSLVACTRLQPLRNPTFEIAIHDNAKIQEAIRQALVRRDWSITIRHTNGFDAVYNRSSQLGAKIRVTHVEGTVTIRYLGSHGLDYSTSNGAAKIHKRYNLWVTNLERDIQIEVGRYL
jgi:hypothetical protein